MGPLRAGDLGSGTGQSGDAYVAHQTAARGMQAEALTHKEVLAAYGLSEAVLEVFGQLLDEFDAAVKLGTDGRAAHTGATKRLDALALQAGQIVRAMDARNRHRFKNDAQTLREWITASTVRRATVSEPGQGTTPEAGGDVRPAA